MSEFALGLAVGWGMAAVVTVGVASEARDGNLALYGLAMAFVEGVVLGVWFLGRML